MWTASAWDIPSVEFLEKYDIPFHKAPSAVLTDIELLQRMQKNNIPLIISTGIGEMEQIKNAISHLNTENLMIAHSTSTYPCKIEELNLRVISTLRNKYNDIPIGYSGHETGLAPTWTAVALGANFVARHITLDRAMWGTDQSASVEIEGFSRLVRNIRDIEKAMGDGIKKIYDSEKPILNKLRKVK
jgi:N-acetylneuraminate synthase